MTASATPPSPTRRPPPRTSQRTFWIRRGVALLVLLLVLGLFVTLVSAIGGGGGGKQRGSAKVSAQAPAAKAKKAPVPLPPATFLPGGGRTIFPQRRVVAFYGNPADKGLGVLGIGTPDQAGAKLLRLSKDYARKTRPILPAMELITSVAARDPGEDGKYRTQIPGSVIDRYLKAARKIHAILVLDIQPGYATFPAEVLRLRKWLDQPDVGLALDPEWRLVPPQIPAQVIGSVSAAEVNQVSATLSNIIKVHNLPQKLFVVHQFTEGMVRQESTIQVRPDLATVFNLDGFGYPANKISKYKFLVPKVPAGAKLGFKVFFVEDTNRMSPKRVMALTPRPSLIVYE